jgi:acyl-CoA hydrolase
MTNMKEISFETPVAFVPTPTHLDILGAVAAKQSCHISQVVQMLHPTHSESSVRSGVRILLSKRYLDGGKSSSEVILRLTSRGRLLIQPTTPS